MFDDDLADLEARGLYRCRRRLDSAQSARVRYRGRELVNFASNDYLNLASDPRLARAAARAAKQYGTGAGASPLVTGYLPPLRRLERDLAAWQETESALVLPSGYQANLAAVATLGRDAIIFSDALNHASLIDGCRLSQAPVHVYRHNDVEHLEELLSRHVGTARRLIVTDSVFSMDGDLAPLPALLELAQRHNAMLLIDEAHATGVFGARGKGAIEHFQLRPDADRIVKIGTLSKALGAQGGFIAGSAKLIDWLVNQARPYIFSTALAPAAAAAARQAVRIVATDDVARPKLRRLGDLLRAGLPPTASVSPIVPLLVGAAAAAMELSRRLEAEGLLVPAIRPPSVPPGTARLRISLTAGHEEEDVRRLLAALRRAGSLTHEVPQ